MKGQKRIDTELLRYLLKGWERRFVDETDPDIEAIIAEKRLYAQKYGYEELNQIVAEVQTEVATELR